MTKITNESGVFTCGSYNHRSCKRVVARAGYDVRILSSKHRVMKCLELLSMCLIKSSDNAGEEYL